MARKAKTVVHLEGLEELKEAFQKLADDISASVLEDAVQAGAEIIVQAANEKAPGPHVLAEIETVSADYAEINVGIDKEHWYYKFFETGASGHEITGAPLVFEGASGLVITGGVSHPGMAAKPFLRPALDENEDRAKEAAGEVIRKAIER